MHICLHSMTEKRITFHLMSETYESPYIEVLPNQPQTTVV